MHLDERPSRPIAGGWPIHLVDDIGGQLVGRPWKMAPSQGCHTSGRLRPCPPNVQTHSTTLRTSTLVVVCQADNKAIGRCDRQTEEANRPLATERGGRPANARAIFQGCPIEAVYNLPSIWGRLPALSVFYNSNFSFLHYVFASLIVVT